MAAIDPYPKPWALFWVLAAAGVGYAAVALALRLRGWLRGGPSPPHGEAPPARVAGIWIAEAVAQRQLLELSRLRWAAHVAIVWGFVGLSFLSLLHVALPALARLSLDFGLADWLLVGRGRDLAKAWGNGWGLVLAAGLVLALVRRVVQPVEPADRAREADLPLVLWLLALTLSGFALEWLRGALAAAAPERADALRPWLTVLWTAHGLGGVGLIAWLPRSTLLHALLAPLVIWLNARAEHHRRDLYWPQTPKRGATGSPRA